jgi:hypothetical protein
MSMGVIRKIKRKVWPNVKFKVDPNSTHRDFLIASVEYLLATTGKEVEIALIEVGTGGTSSEVLRAFIESNEKLSLLSFENDANWLAKYKSDYASHERHEIVFVTDNDWTATIEKYVSRISLETKVLSFIDSSPWESRISALNVLKPRSELLLVHDVDYFPHNELLGIEKTPIKYAPANPFFYGKLKSKNLGSRNYDDFAKNWIEAFPRVPGYFTGPPTLIASETINVEEINLAKGSVIRTKSEAIM